MRKRPIRPIDKTALSTNQEQFLALDPAALDTPERILAYCRDRGFINGNVTNIQGLIEDNPNLELSFEDIKEYDAFIEKTNTASFRIVINSKHPPTRQRFSMAHEYIHYQIHRDEIEKLPHGERILHRSEEKDKREYAANQCAGEILMPEQTFMQIAHAGNGDIAKIAKAFDVSLLAVRYRAKILGIAGHGLVEDSENGF